MELIGKWITDNWISILVGVIVIPWLFFNVIPYCWNNYIAVINISPKAKNIICSNSQFRKETFYVYLTNNSSNPIYDITVVARHPKGVDVSIYPEREQAEEVSFGNMKIGTSFIIHGYDEKNVGSQETFINNLAPKETAKLKVEIDKRDYYNNFKLRIRATFKSKTPKPILSSR